MIVFVRHGQTAVNRDGRLQGRLDAPLSDLGLQQARAIARVLRKEAVTRVVSSPLVRAFDTATEIAEPHDEIVVETDDRLIELDYGTWDGVRLQDVPAAEWAAWRADPEFTPPEGESLVAVTVRVSAFIEEALSADGVVVAVSHVSPIKAAVCCALGIEEYATWRMHLGLASITRVGSRPDGTPFLLSYNESAHLTELR